MANRRYTGLDGLRGFAALVVVFHHALLLSPSLAAAYRSGGGATGWVHALISTPLHLVWAGGEAVYVFFVLSGFVLALPFLGDRRPSWAAYYAQRAVRLYVPVLGSLVFALLLFLAVARADEPEMSWWLNSHTADLTARQLFNDATLWAPGSYNSALWSLKYEVLFSLLLPVYLIVAVRAQALAPLLVVGALSATALGVEMENRVVIYLPMFAIGVVMATCREKLRKVRMPNLAWAAWALVAWALVTVRWWAPGPQSVLTAAAALGAAMVVFLFVASAIAQRVGNSPPGQWLGTRSFSLYLVHEPVLVTLGFALPWLGAFGVLAIGLPLSLMASAVFFRVVEAPGHRAARSVGRALGRQGMAQTSAG